MQRAETRQRLLDALAIGASALCLIHCLALPVAIILLPALAAFLVVPEVFHMAALGFAVPTSVVAMATGYRRHGWLLPSLIALPAMVLLAIGALAADDAWTETMTTVGGALFLSAAHAFNWRALPRAEPA